MKRFSRFFRWLPPLALASCAAPREGQATLARLQAPGFFIATQPAGGPPVIQATGHADWEKSVPVTADMHFRIGSVTKLFIGNLVLILRDEGKLDLDSPIGRYVPGVPAGDRITLRQLGNHTSGLPDAIDSRVFQNAIVADPGKTWSRREILAHAFAREPHFPPGSSWKYSNTNTILLAMAAEDATGKSCATLLEEKILTPLSLRHTAFPEGGMIPDPHPSGYRHARKGHPIGYGKILMDVSGYSASWTNAAGDLCSTAGDLILAARPLCEGTLLSQSGRQILHDWQETGQPGYRYGFCIESWNGFIGHRGSVPGYQAVIAIDQKSGTAHAVAANLSNTRDGKEPASEWLEATVRGRATLTD